MTDSMPPGYSRSDLERFMLAALTLAEEAGLAGEMPIGAVVVIDGEIVSRGRARHQERRSQLHPRTAWPSKRIQRRPRRPRKPPEPTSYFGHTVPPESR